MRKKMTSKVMAVALTAAMAMSVVACGDNNKPADNGNAPADGGNATVDDGGNAAGGNDVVDDQGDVEPYTVITDADGNTVDLGGMVLKVRSWFNENYFADPQNDFQEQMLEYRKWACETYNFTVEEVVDLDDWGSIVNNYTDYVTSGGDDNYYLWVTRGCPTTTASVLNKEMYDLSKLDCLDFTEFKFKRNGLADMYTLGGATYAMRAAFPEPRTGVYFNADLLKARGVDPESIYDAQKNGTWDSKMFEDIMTKVQGDTDGDGVDDVYGLTLNEGVMTEQAVLSNNGAFIGKDASGNFYCDLENPNTVEALEWTVDMFNKFDQHDPEGAQWDYYKEEFRSGKVAFCVDQEYIAANGSDFLAFTEDETPFEVGFVMFPRMPKADTMYNVTSDNLYVIPSCYDDEKAWKIAFAYNVITENPTELAEQETYSQQVRTKGCVDERACSETIPMMCEAEHTKLAYHSLVPNLDMGPDLTWGIGPGAVVSEKIDAIKDTWKQYCDDANAKLAQ